MRPVFIYSTVLLLLYWLTHGGHELWCIIAPFYLHCYSFAGPHCQSPTECFREFRRNKVDKSTLSSNVMVEFACKKQVFFFVSSGEIRWTNPHCHQMWWLSLPVRKEFFFFVSSGEIRWTNPHCHQMWRLSLPLRKEVLPHTSRSGPKCKKVKLDAPRSGEDATSFTRHNQKPKIGTYQATSKQTSRTEVEDSYVWNEAS